MKGRGPHHPFKLSGVVLEIKKQLEYKLNKSNSFKITKKELIHFIYMAYEQNFSRCHRKGK